MAGPATGIAAAAVAFLVVFGAVAFVNDFWQATPASNPGTEQTTASTLSPARDVTGTWTGPASLKDTGGPECSYQGPTVLNLTQYEGDVEGVLSIDPLSVANQPTSQPCDMPSFIQGPVYGTVSSSSISLRDDYGDTFTGSFTTDTMTLHGVAASEPTPPGAQCVSDCGWTGTFTLNRISTAPPFPYHPTTTTQNWPTTTTTASTTTAVYFTTTQGGGGVPTSTITLRQADYYFTGGSDCTHGCNVWEYFSLGQTFYLQGSIQGKDQFYQDWYQDGPTGSIPYCTVDTVTWKWVSGTSIDYTQLSLTTSPSSATIPNGGTQDFTSTFTLLYSGVNGQPFNSTIDLVYQGTCA